MWIDLVEIMNVQQTLDKAIKKKSCVRITENANDSEMHMGAVIRSIDCPKK